MKMTDLHSSPQIEPETLTIESLPYALGCEKSVLSLALQNASEYLPPMIEAGITEAHFYQPAHQTLYALMLERYGNNQIVELVEMMQILNDRGKLASIGGASYLSEIYTYNPSGSNLSGHIEQIRNKYTLRELLRAATEIVAAVREDVEQPEAIMDEAERQILAIRESGLKEPDASPLHDMKAIANEFGAMVQGDYSKAKGISTGFANIDKKTGGLMPAEMFVIAARPSQGKSALMMNIVESLALDQNLPVLVFSAEMSRESLLKRLTYARARLNYLAIKHGKRPDKGEMLRFQGATKQIMSASLYIDATPSPTINQIRAKARRYHRRHGIAAIALDYIQLCKSTSKQAQTSREREVAEISATLKALAKELNIPVIALAQLNRDSDKRSGSDKGRPRMSDLRESGSIEQDADVIALLTRAAYYASTDEEKERVGGRAELIIAKNRNGETGTAWLNFIESQIRFEDGDELPQQEFKPTKKSRWEH